MNSLIARERRLGTSVAQGGAMKSVRACRATVSHVCAGEDRTHSHIRSPSRIEDDLEWRALDRVGPDGAVRTRVVDTPPREIQVPMQPVKREYGRAFGNRALALGVLA